MIAQQPRPSGSQANALARDYIAEQLQVLGLTLETQRFPLQKDGRNWAGTNIIALLRGREDSKIRGALALVCHHDSVPRGPGAGDDGAAVATFLETARALKSGEALQNDVIFLFTDAEELNLEGARAFVAESPWAKRVQMVLNFDARGVSGPVYMFETSRGNSRLVEQLAEAAPRPGANSLMSEVYRHMPNDTDLTVFRKAGIAGLNFAFIGDPQYYHSAKDDIDHFQLATLQHQGSYALSLARQFGNLDLGGLAGPDAVYFDLFGRVLIRYPASWAIPLAVGCGIFVCGVLARWTRRGETRWRGILLSLLLWPLIWLGGGVVCWFAPVLAGKIRQHLPSGFWAAPLWTLGILLTFLFFTLSYLIARRFLRASELAAGAWLWWSILSLAIAFSLPGASYLTTWPLLGVVGPGIFSQGHPLSLWTRSFWLAVSGLVAMILISPLVSAFYIALGPGALFVPMLVLALEIALLTLCLDAVLGTFLPRALGPVEPEPA